MNMLEQPTEQEAPLPDENSVEETPVEGEGGYHVTADQIEQEVIKQLEPEKVKQLDRILEAGYKMLFSKETSSQLFDSIRPDDQVPLADELGSGTTNAMMLLFKESNGSMPQDLIIPAGTILLAKAGEFINETNLEEMTDDVYAEAVELFSVAIQDKLNPNFREENGMVPEEQPQQEAPQEAPPEQQGGMMQQPQGAV